MAQQEQRFCLEVWGDYACFTRPEMKVERVSYDVITPSAVRAIFEAILWKPAIRWHVHEIEVLNPIKWISVRRNEVGSVASEKKDAIFIEENRLQRAGLFLRDVRYRLHAYLEYIPVQQRHTNFCAVPEVLWDAGEIETNRESRETWKHKRDESPGKYLAMFERRAKKGQCFYQPYLGCREFSAFFKFIKAPEQNPAIRITHPPMNLGFMLYDMDFSDPDDPRPAFYRPEMKDGRIRVPEWSSQEVRR